MIVYNKAFCLWMWFKFFGVVLVASLKWSRWRERGGKNKICICKYKLYFMWWMKGAASKIPVVSKKTKEKKKKEEGKENAVVRKKHCQHCKVSGIKPRPKLFHLDLQ